MYGPGDAAHKGPNGDDHVAAVLEAREVAENCAPLLE